MVVFLEVVLWVLFLLIFYQDMIKRAIHIVLPLLIILIGLILFFERSYPIIILWHNFLFLLVTCLGLYVYLSLKERKFVNLFKSIGKGDFLFFLAVIPYFSTINYILYFITGMLFSIFAFLVIKMISKTNLVPLAGLLAIYMLILKCIVYITDLDFFEAKLV